MKFIIVFLMISGLTFAQDPVCSPACSATHTCVEDSGMNVCLINCDPECGAGEICFSGMLGATCFKDCLDSDVECNACVNGYEQTGTEICRCTGDFSGPDCNVRGSPCGKKCEFGEAICINQGCYYKVSTTPDPTTTGTATTEPTPTVPTTLIPTPTVPTTLIPTPTVPTTFVPTPTVPTTPVPTPTVPTTPVPTPTIPTTPAPTTEPPALVIDCDP